MNGVSSLTISAALASMLLTCAPVMAAKVCNPAYTGRQTLWMPGKALAEASAASIWSTGVANKYSISWSNWRNASSKNYSCRKKTSFMGANVWKCRAIARPCKYD